MKHKVIILDNIYWVGVNDRRTHLFENYWPLPHGVSYNSYLIDDEKVALFDTVDRVKSDDFLENIYNIISDKPIDYLIINHIEPDHSGSINILLDKYPRLQIVGNSKTFAYLEKFYGITENLIQIKEGDTLDLGFHRIKFFMTPLVHWPETMVSFEETKGVLFSGDAFGAFGTLDGNIFDDQIELNSIEEEISRYYTNIVGKYAKPTKNALLKLENLNITHICPTHGPVWRSHIKDIITKYTRWSNHETEKGVTIVFGSMYGYTEKIAEYLALGFANQGINDIKIYDVSKTHPSYILNRIYQKKGVLIGSPTYNNALFPKIDGLLNEIKNIGMRNHVLGVFGSSLWTPGRSVRLLKEFAENIKWEFIDQTPETIGNLTSSVWEKCDALIEEMVKKL